MTQDGNDSDWDLLEQRVKQFQVETGIKAVPEPDDEDDSINLKIPSNPEVSEDGLQMRGFWSVTEAYSAFDMVFHEDEMWMAQVGSTGEEPDGDTPVWVMISHENPPDAFLKNVPKLMGQVMQPLTPKANTPSPPPHSSAPSEVLATMELTFAMHSERMNITENFFNFTLLIFVVCAVGGLLISWITSLL